MAAAQGHFSDHSDHSDHANGTGDRDGSGGDTTPRAFRLAVEALRGAAPRPEIGLEPARPPQRLAPYAYALEATVADDPDGEEEVLADGRLVLLYAPEGHEAWQGRFRLVTLVRAELEPEMAADPLLPEVSWSWLTGALETRGLGYGEPSGTVTRAGSHYFGGLAARRPATQIEIRASWSPEEGPDGVPDMGAHLVAWCDLLSQIAGLPPSPTGGTEAGAGVVSLPQRRGPRQR
ncbi:DUF3000 domain-containing protein [Streptomyces clavuligerus]|uniref:DUF3000 domain-containing protein n=1 Tax=Streptomyces clavuligerus TaxID=1901 RepID=E2PVT1_STRCL|nr:DUF3000 domain-containing protein [Streptomyces clavuligerus]ANW17570.1 hypothetical protein BB341_04685 [Streptomyces clavuligerus]AXU12119.1 DUF3000 domain-containing protein [Streptomyces clavuligerus]EFG09921.1 Hypothetical protein SCLAV_4848 [Streptomyces clavuligerus]MBY6301982.1 DUF3000 domain-containing protein [Streptomyces clavuligerus]QCS04898.1 DUF3000 domain-containing protein [Streptomyces clavuligerus]